MKNAEFRRRLAALGVEFKEGAKHTKLYFNGAQITLPRHKDDLGIGLMKSILSHLGIKEFDK